MWMMREPLRQFPVDAACRLFDLDCGLEKRFQGVLRISFSHAFPLQAM